jgi:hypothetical protein
MCLGDDFILVAKRIRSVGNPARLTQLVLCSLLCFMNQTGGGVERKLQG